MDINKILDNYRNDIRYREFDGKYIVALPIFFPGSHNSIAIRLEADTQGRPSISDCHTTLDYLDEMGVDINKYSSKLEKIMTRYGLVQNDREFTLNVPTDNEDYLTKYLGYFVQAISLIANIDM